MSNKILGIDLGTNSIGLSVRNPELSGQVSNQLEYFTSIIFPSGVGTNQSGEFSYAAERTKHRSARRLNQARRYRIWKTLEVLIQHQLCPLSIEELDQWRTYDKNKGLKREYPVHALRFEQWVRLDINGDGLVDYTSPYQLRAELMSRQLDFSQENERYRLGRALYHIAQRRGFKSSKGETLQEQEDVAKGEDMDIATAMKQSEEKKSKDLVAYMEENHCKTVGCAFYQMECAGIRVRANEKYQATRSLYEDEIKQIFAYQEALQDKDQLLQTILSRKKGEGSIFYKRPLRSQKSAVGKCTFEPTKSRCPISRPEFEIYRAWSIINTLRYKTKEDGDQSAARELALELRKSLFEERFANLARDSFKMDDILKWLQKKNTEVTAINYDSKVSVMGCPVLYRLKMMLGEDWLTARLNKHYNYEDLWHVCFTADDNEEVEEFVKNHLNGVPELMKKMLALNGKIKTDYASLSLKAIRNITFFLEKGYLYNEAVVLAKLPEIFGDNWAEVESVILKEWNGISIHQQKQRSCYKIVNTLIAQDKLAEPEERTAFHDTTYLLTESDRKAVTRAIIDTMSYKAWKAMNREEQADFQAQVEEAYQNYFRQEKRTYYEIENQSQALERLLRDNFREYMVGSSFHKLEQGGVLYHPSMVDIYPAVRYTQYIDERGLVSKKMVQSPKTDVFRNPMVMRVLHTLRGHINRLIKENIIDEETRIVIETARELNDANQRWAIQSYQEKRREENKKYREQLLAYLPEDKIKDTDIEKVRLWEEQGKRCLYTGEVIGLSDLLNDNQYEVEHTLPRSKSFDDSLANKTICQTHFNRYIKKNRCPKDLGDMYYPAIEERLKPWDNKIASLKKQIIERSNKAKSASTKEQKDRMIRERHVLEMELHYWMDKVGRFKKSEDDLNLGFRHSQLSDTRIITKYAYHLLRATFDHVSVQRGEMTADFRKALGIQSIEEKKDRSKHSHHAIDAAILTLIPANNLRDRLLELFYQKEESEKLGQDTTWIEKEYAKCLKSCNIHGVEELPTFIEGHILIQYQVKDQALVPSSKKVRVRGKVVKKRDKELFQRGETIRGQLHKQTWYGAIAEPQTDEQGRLIRDTKGHFLTTGKINYVVRVDLKYKKSSTDSGFKTWEELGKVMVDQSLFEYMKKEYPDLEFKDAIEKGLVDKQGKKIRHIRCYTRLASPLEVKKHTHLSEKDYKQFYYADGGEIYVMAKYVSEPQDIYYVVYSLFDVSKNRKENREDIPRNVSYKGKLYHLDSCMHKGQQMLLYREHEDEIRGLPSEVLSRHLYVINRIESDGRIRLIHHLSAKTDKELGNGESIKDYEHLPKKIRCGINGLHYLLEGKDFCITPKGIEFEW